MKITVRSITREDAERFSIAFTKQGWQKTVSLFLSYYTEQQVGKRKVFVAEFGGELLGYVTLIPQTNAGPFKDKPVPAIVDFNVLEMYQQQGIGTILIDAVEEFAKQKFDQVCLAVGLHKGYGPAQKLFAKRGFIPDGTGLWYGDRNLEKMEIIANDDSLFIYMYKDLKKIIR